MNKKGFFLGPQAIALIVGLLVLLVTYLFFKSFFMMSLGLIIGVGILWKIYPSVSKKHKDKVLAFGVLLILSSLFVGIAQPFNIFGDELRYSTGSFYAGTSISDTWVWLTGHGANGTVSDDSSKSYLANDALKVNVRVQSTKAATEGGVTVYGGSPTYCWDGVRNPPAVCMFQHFTGTVNNVMTFSGEHISNWGFRLYLDGRDNGVFGSFSPTSASYIAGGSGYNQMNMVTGVYTTGFADICSAYSTQKEIDLCNAQNVHVSLNTKSSFYSLINISKNLQELNYDKNKYNHSIRLVATSLDGFAYNMDVYSSNFYVEPIACSDSGNYVTKMFTASSGDVVSLNPKVGEIGIPSDAVFCHTLPILKQAWGTTFEQDYLPYETLKTGESITIPSGQNWIFFYKGAPTTGGYYSCADNNGIFNSTTNKCVIAPAIEYTCVSGVYNPITKTCMTQAAVQKICSAGVYNTDTDRCEYIPPVSILCSEGTYNSVSKKCEVYPSVANICSSGNFNVITQKCEVFPLISNICFTGTYEDSKGMCVFNPDTVIVCSQGTFDNTTQKCIYSPNISNVCSKGNYNAISNTCVFIPNVSNVCEKGIYNSSSNTCVFSPDVSNVCTIGSYNSNTNTCVFSPNVTPSCTQGTYNSATNTCVYTPSVANVCEKGIYNSSSNTCIYTPGIATVCSKGVFDNSSNTCIFTPNVSNVCEKGTYNETSGLCVINPETKFICLAGVLEGDVCVVNPEIKTLTAIDWVFGLWNNFLSLFGLGR